MTHRSGGTLRVALVSLAVVVGLVLGGCSSDDGGSANAWLASRSLPHMTQRSTPSVTMASHLGQ